MSVVRARQEGPSGRVVESWTIDRPPVNAIDAGVLDALDAAIAGAERDASIGAVVVTGGGGKAFVAGADIAAMASMTALQAEHFAARGQAVLDRLSRLPMPVIAAVNGVALGGGCELAMACDLVFAGQRAAFGQPEVKLGVIPGFGGTQRLVRRVGWTNALDLCLTGRTVTADEALRMGLCSRVLEGDVAQGAVQVALEMLALGPVALRLCKRAVHENADLSLSAAQAAERTLFGLCFATADQDEGMAAFLGKRAANFSGS